MAKIQVADALHRAVDTAIQLLGAKGYSKDTPLEWMYRYARQARLVDGASEVHRMVVARELLEHGRGLLRMALSGQRRRAGALARRRNRCRRGHRRACCALLGGGAIQENWALDVVCTGGPLDGRHELVLRTDAASRVPVSWSRKQEFRSSRRRSAPGSPRRSRWRCARTRRSSASCST